MSEGVRRWKCCPEYSLHQASGGSGESGAKPLLQAPTQEKVALGWPGNRLGTEVNTDLRADSQVLHTPSLWVPDCAARAPGDSGTPRPW